MIYLLFPFLCHDLTLTRFLWSNGISSYSAAFYDAQRPVVSGRILKRLEVLISVIYLIIESLKQACTPYKIAAKVANPAWWKELKHKNQNDFFNEINLFWSYSVIDWTDPVNARFCLVKNYLSTNRCVYHTSTFKVVYYYSVIP